MTTETPALKSPEKTVVPRLQTSQRELAQKIAQHEMAHYVVARVLGFKTTHVELCIFLDGTHRGAAAIDMFEPLRSLEDVASYLERRILVLMAGVLGESLPPPQAPATGVDVKLAEEIFYEGRSAEQDFAKVRELIFQLRNIAYPESETPSQVQNMLTATCDRLWARAIDLVEQFEATITGLGCALVQRIPGVDLKATFTADELENLPAVKALPRLIP